MVHDIIIICLLLGILFVELRGMHDRHLMGRVRDLVDGLETDSVMLTELLEDIETHCEKHGIERTEHRD